MADWFDAFAYNPDTNELLNGATFQVFAEGDLSKENPLPVYEAKSGALLSPLMSNHVGALPQFSVSGDPQVVILKSGDFETRLKSAEGSRGPSGKSAYQYAVDGGFLGDEETFSEYLSAAGRSIAYVEIIGGDLLITTKDGEVFNAGTSVGADGRGIASVSVVDGQLLVTMTDATVDNAGALPPGPPVSTAGSSAGEVYTSTGDGSDPTWAAPTGGSGIEGAPEVWPSAFPPAAHNTETSTLRVGGAELAAVVLTLLGAGNAAAARAAIGAGTGNGSSNLTIGTGAGNAAAGNHTHAASSIGFTPTGEVTATNVQAAIAQAAALGSGGSNAFVYYDGDDWPDDVPSTEYPKLWVSSKHPDAPDPEPLMAVGDGWLPHPDYVESL